MNRLLILTLCLLATGAQFGLAKNSDVKKFCLFEVNGVKRFGLIKGDRVLELEGNIYGSKGYNKTKTEWRKEDVSFFMPYGRWIGEDDLKWVPTAKIYCIADNYGPINRSQSKTKRDALKKPAFAKANEIPIPFLKHPSSLIGYGGTILLPDSARKPHSQAEMVVIIRKEARKVSVDDALKYVLGVSCGNDITLSRGNRNWAVPNEKVILTHDSDWSQGELAWAQAKSFETFGPIGPNIVSGLNYDNLEIKMWDNDKLRQHDNTKNMRYSVAEIVSYLSLHTTLQPGDMIFTGTPGQRIKGSSGKKSTGRSDNSTLKEGHNIKIMIEGVGVLKNPVAQIR